MATVNEIVTAFGFKVEGDALKNLETIQNGINGIAEGFNGLGKFFTGGKSITDYFKGFIGASNDMINLSKATGYSTDSLQKWQYAATAMGVSADSVVNDLGQLKNSFGWTEKRVLSFANQMKNSSTFARKQWQGILGISPDTMLLLSEGSTAIGKYLDQAERAGAVTARKDLEQSSQLYRDLALSMTELGKTTDQVMAKTVPSIQNLMKSFNDWLGDKPDEKINLITTALIGMGTVSVLSSISNLAVNIGNLAMSLKILAPYAAILSSLAAIGTAAYTGGEIVAGLVNGESFIDNINKTTVGELFGEWGEPFGDWYYKKINSAPSTTPVPSNVTTNSNNNATSNVINNTIYIEKADELEFSGIPGTQAS